MKRYTPLKEANKETLEAWLEKTNEILDEVGNEPDTKKRKAIIHRNKSHWCDAGLLEFLKGLSDDKCWYTEAKFTVEYTHLEDFRPKICARNENWERCHEGGGWRLILKTIASPSLCQIPAKGPISRCASAQWQLVTLT